MISVYELCAIVATICFIFITIYLVRLLNSANNTVKTLEETNKDVKEIVGNVKDAVSLVNPLLNTMKDAKKMLQQVRGVMDGFKGKKEFIQEEVKKKTDQFKNRKGKTK